MTKYYVFDLKTFTFIFMNGKIKNEKEVTDQLNEICLIGIKRFPVYAFADKKLIIFSKKGDDDNFDVVPKIENLPRKCDFYNFEDVSTFDVSFERTLKAEKVAKIIKILESTRALEFIHYEIE